MPSPSANTTSVRPLVVRFGAFGDMVLMVPLLKFLAARYGQPCDVVSSGPWTEPLLQRVPAAATRIYLTSRRAPYWFNRSQREFVRWLRTRPAGPVYVFEPDEKPLSLLHRGGVATTHICTLRDFPRLPGEHILDQSFRLARATPAAYADAFPVPALTPDARPTLSDADRRDCADWLASKNLSAAPLILLQPGNKKTMKRGRRQRRTNTKFWLEDNWARVIDGVRAAQPDARVLICGSPAERPLAEDIVRLARADGVVIATDDLPIPRLLALQERAASMISVDTGPAHSAAAMGCPLVVLFGSIDPQFYAPRPTTAAVQILRAPDTAIEFPLNSLSPDTVLAAWRALAKR